jgi:hypothetical protein
MEVESGNPSVHHHHKWNKSGNKDRLETSFQQIRDFTMEVDKSLDERRYPRKEIIIFESPVHKRQRELHNRTVQEVQKSKSFQLSYRYGTAEVSELKTSAKGSNRDHRAFAQE